MIHFSLEEDEEESETLIFVSFDCSSEPEESFMSKNCSVDYVYMLWSFYVR